MSTEADTAPATDPKKQLDRGLEELGLELDRSARKRLLAFAELLEKWNRVYNLTGIRGADQIVSGHLLDCLAIVPHIASTGRALDVGSGAGFPGIPLAIARPRLQVTLLDSNQKKAAFLRQAVGELQLDNATVIEDRVEAWQPQEKFDVIVSRALTDTGEFVRWSRHLLAPGGVFAAMKGVVPGDELVGLPQGYRLHDTVRLSVPGLEAQRHLILVERA
ncbi:MAG TPA: 16S rRNA (guanine(527)-N(7))-methyltransferase RsmG [Burkholderiales bacterium]|nr:16S rRNA (guanine(527)-N(7))-methyltransferase RsmG [Burkholderiales bacterium]